MMDANYISEHLSSARRIDPALVVGDALGQHSTTKPDSFTNGPSIAVFEALGDHKEHDPECTLLGPR